MLYYEFIGKIVTAANEIACVFHFRTQFQVSIVPVAGWRMGTFDEFTFLSCSEMRSDEGLVTFSIVSFSF